MNLELLISNMLKVNVLARLWHWRTDTAQHHVTFEQFLTQNEVSMDSLVESALGNDIELDFANIGITKASEKAYSLEEARTYLRSYRSQINEIKQSLEESTVQGTSEIVTILDDVTEQTSKTLYLLKLK